MSVKRIISGGQTGVDRGALDAAMILGVAHGGWCPHGRLAEDGQIPDQYHLVEAESADYAVRTKLNVMDADGTLILHLGPLSGGTELTRRLCVKHHRPHWLVDLDASPDAASVLYWLDEQQIKVLNVAGPRGSALAGLNVIARDFLLQVFHDMS